MYTSHFGNLSKILANGLTPVSIARSAPRGFSGHTYPVLAPSWNLISVKDEKEYTRRYKSEVLSGLDPASVAANLPPNAVLLCWERPGEFCHRRLVARWIEDATGLLIPEWGVSSERCQTKCIADSSGK